MSAIDRIEYIPCGFCTNNRAVLFQREMPRTIRFTAGVFLLHHKTKGFILYDTGYSPEIIQSRYLFYRLLNPVRMRRRDGIDRALKRRGIAPESIRHVILSHLHADHIGGASFFPNATFYMTADAAAVLQKPSPRDFFFSEFLPHNLSERLITLCKDSSRMPPPPPERGEDLFGDGSLLVSCRGGHAKGQALLYLPDFHLLFASDLCWGMELLPITNRMRIFSKCIQDDYPLYRKNAACLERWKKEGMRIIVSHDPPKRIRRILDAIF